MNDKLDLPQRIALIEIVVIVAAGLFAFGVTGWIACVLYKGFSFGAPG